MHRRFDAPARSIDRWIISTYTQGGELVLRAAVPAQQRNEFQKDRRGEKKRKKRPTDERGVYSIHHPPPRFIS